MASPVTCPSCKAQNLAGAKFCSNCGQAIPQKPVPLICPTCGTELTPGARFCSNCGTPMNATQPKAQQAPQTAPVKQAEPEQPKEEYVDAAEFFAAQNKKRENEARSAAAQQGPDSAPQPSPAQPGGIQQQARPAAQPQPAQAPQNQGPQAQAAAPVRPQPTQQPQNPNNGQPQRPVQPNNQNPQKNPHAQQRQASPPRQGNG